MWNEYDIATSDNRPYFFRPWLTCPACGRCHCGKSSHCFSDGPKPDYQVHYISYADTAAGPAESIEAEPEEQTVHVAAANPKSTPPAVSIRCSYRGDSKLEKVGGTDWDTRQTALPHLAPEIMAKPEPEPESDLQPEILQKQEKPYATGDPAMKTPKKDASWIIEYDLEPAGGQDEAEETAQEEEPAPLDTQPQGPQAHVHEFHGTVKLDDYDGNVHNHRVAGISGEAIKTPLGHAHKIWTRTDFFDHFHWLSRMSGPAVYVGSGKPRKHANVAHYEDEQHVHYVDGLTSINDGHNHEFQFATLIDSPLLPEFK